MKIMLKILTVIGVGIIILTSCQYKPNAQITLEQAELLAIQQFVIILPAKPVQKDDEIIDDIDCYRFDVEIEDKGEIIAVEQMVAVSKDGQNFFQYSQEENRWINKKDW